MESEGGIYMKAVFVLIGLCACASAPKAYNVERSVTFPGHSYDEVWTALIQSFSDVGWPIGTIEKDSGIVTTDWMSTTARDGYLDCGGSGIGSDSNHTGRFTAFLKSDNIGPSLTVNASFQATRTVMREYNTIQCVSTGRIEERVKSAVRERLSSP